MAHCPFELLDDLADVLADVRTWPGVIEKHPGVFYARRAPFLHFHLLAGARRCADVKGKAGWVRIDLPRPVTPAARRALYAELRERHRERLAPAP